MSKGEFGRLSIQKHISESQLGGRILRRAEGPRCVMSSERSCALAHRHAHTHMSSTPVFLPIRVEKGGMCPSLLLISPCSQLDSHLSSLFSFGRSLLILGFHASKKNYTYIKRQAHRDRIRYQTWNARAPPSDKKRPAAHILSAREIGFCSDIRLLSGRHKPASRSASAPLGREHGRNNEKMRPPFH